MRNSDFRPTLQQKDNRKDKNVYTVIALNNKKKIKQTSERFLLNQWESPTRILENAFCQLHNLFV
jgi:hypothetical protein